MSRFPLWGRVVGHDTAQRLPKATLFDMGDSNGRGPRLFLDGSLHMNPVTTHCCLGWLVPPLPTQPAKKKEDAALRSALLSSDFTDAEVDKMIQGADDDGDGPINYSNLTTIMRMIEERVEEKLDKEKSQFVPVGTSGAATTST